MKSQIKGIFYIVVFTFCFIQTAFSQEAIEIDSGFYKAEVKQTQIFFLEDARNQLGIEDIVQEEYQEKFQVIPKNTPNFGITNHVYWLKIILQKDDLLFPELYLLEVAYPNLDSIELFSSFRDGGWSSLLLGDLVPFSQRPYQHRYFIFPIHLDQTSQAFYIKIRTKGSVLAPLILHSEKSLRENQVSQETFYGIFFGVLLIMGFYNLFLFFFLRDRIYLLYVFYITSMIFAQASMTGHTGQYFWGDAIYWNNKAILFFVSISTGTVYLFSIYFLGIKKFQTQLYYPMHSMMLFSFVFAPLSFLIDYNISVKVVVLSVLAASIFMLTAGIIIWRTGNRYARFFTLAWSTLFLGSILWNLVYLGLLPDTFLTRHSLQIGTALEVSLLSIALADKINLLKMENERFQLQNLQLVREQNESLERRVNERTLDLQESYEETRVMNEELRQMHEELEAQRDFLDEKSQKLDIQNNKISSSIKVALNIQEAILPNKKKLDDCLKEYFVIHHPKDVVSGDFFWLSKVGKKTVLCAIDCTGHGVPGAFISLIGSLLLKKIVNSWLVTDPARIISMLHEEIQSTLRQDETKDNSGMDMSVVVWEAREDQKINLCFAGAKNSLFYIRPTYSEIQEIKGDRRSIGGQLDGNLSFTRHEFVLENKTIIYVGSDGFEDQNNAKRKKLGKTRLKRNLLRAANMPLSLQKKHLESFLWEHMKGTTQRDDILLIGVLL